MVSPFVLGVDGGNTKTIALVARCDGTIVASGRGGNSDIYGAGSPEAALAQLDATTGDALQSAGLRPDNIAAACFSLAGADWPEDFDLLRAGLERRGFARGLEVVNDALGGLRAGLPDGFGVAVICGTGTATGARAPDGRVWWSSWWQDVHGADQLGRVTLRAVYRAELGLDPPTALRRRVLQFFDLPTVEEVLHTMTARVRDEPAIHRLAPALLDEAGAGDATACHIVSEHGAALGDYALVAARRVGLADAPFLLSLSGGVLRHPSPLLRDALVARVQRSAPGVQASLSRFEPAAGAVMLALEQADVVVDEHVRARLEASLPPASLFRTVA